MAIESIQTGWQTGNHHHQQRLVTPSDGIFSKNNFKTKNKKRKLKAKQKQTVVKDVEGHYETAVDCDGGGDDDDDDEDGRLVVAVG